MVKMWMLCAACGLLAAADLKITHGLSDNQVLQRDSHGLGEVRLKGNAKGRDGASIEARVLYGRWPAGALDWRPIAQLNGGTWQADVKDIPTGGPYRLELRISGEDTVVAVNNLLVGDLWVLAGQSNMQGVGDLVDVAQPHGLVHSFSMTDQWVLAEEPLHTLVDAADRVHWPRNANKEPERFEGERLRKFLVDRKKGSGLGLPFAKEMVGRTGVPVGLLPCAHGGTSMDQWDPALQDQGGDSLYGSMLRRVRAAGGRVAGVLWYQGESDANPRAAPLFQEKFERFVAAVRTDTGIPDLPFYYVQIGRHVSHANEAEWNVVQESQRRAEQSIPRAGMVAAVDTELDDGIHVGTGDLERLGKRMANLACRDLFPGQAKCAQLKRGPRPASAVYHSGVVRVEFSEVNGGLVSPGRISGFSVHTSQGNPSPAIYKIKVDPSDPAALLIYIQGKLPPGATLRYGYGKDPYCNLRDQADMAAPVFGPFPIRMQ